MLSRVCSFLSNVKSVTAKIDPESLVPAFATCSFCNLQFVPTGRVGVPVCFWWRRHRSLFSGSSSSCCSSSGRGGGNSVWTRAWGLVRGLWGPGVSRRQSWRRDHLCRVQPAGTRRQTKRHSPEQLSLLLLLPRWASLRGWLGAALDVSEKWSGSLSRGRQRHRPWVAGPVVPFSLGRESRAGYEEGPDLRTGREHGVTDLLVLSGGRAAHVPAPCERALPRAGVRQPGAEPWEDLGHGGGDLRLLHVWGKDLPYEVDGQGAALTSSLCAGPSRSRFTDQRPLVFVCVSLCFGACEFLKT